MAGAADTGHPVDNWSCSVASGSYVLGCKGCTVGASAPSSKGIWLNTTAIIVTVFGMLQPPYTLRFRLV